MTSKMPRIIWCFLSFIVISHILTTTIQTEALPATSTHASTHIVSYVSQRKLAKSQKAGQHDEFADFDFETFHSNSTEMKGALQQLFGRFVENLETNLDKIDKPIVAKSANLKQNVEEQDILQMQETDDLQDLQANTLETGFGNNEQHESQINDTMWQRSKQSIPVLESVRRLVHSVRDGALNHTDHVKAERHHQLLNGTMHSMKGENETSAIETEEEREMINEGSDLRFLETLGSIGSRLWGFLSGLKKVFAASSGSASAALSAQSSSTSS